MSGTESKRVRCVCNGVKVAATYELKDGFLILTAPFGTMQVTLGIQNPRKVASKLMKNLCEKATADDDAMSPCCGVAPLPAPSASDVAPAPPLPTAVAKKP